MKIKLIVILLLWVILGSLNSLTRVIGQTGNEDYSSIQAAIDDSAPGDTLLVLPGRYFESLSIETDNLTLQSNYALTNNREDIDDTIIDGNAVSNCLDVEANNTVINGLTFTNAFEWPAVRLYYDIGNVTILNNVIKNNCASGLFGTWGSTIFLAGNVIKNNHSNFSGTGMKISGNSNYSPTIVEFDQVNLNSIFNNYGDVQDIYFKDVLCDAIYLDTISVALDYPDNFFIHCTVGELTTEEIPYPQIFYQNTYLEQIDADLYVSPNGNDNNSGLSMDEPFRTIQYATKMIKSNPQQINSVYLLPGTYSKLLNEQIFPISLPAHTRLLGLGETPQAVIIGDEPDNVNIAMIATQTEAGNFTVRSNIHSYSSAVGIYGKKRDFEEEEYYLHDVILENCSPDGQSLAVQLVKNATIENILIRDVTVTDHHDAGYVFGCYQAEVNLNNIEITNINSYIDDLVLVMDFGLSSVNANNLIFHNNYSNTGYLMQFTNYEGIYHTDNQANFSNVLAYRNYFSANIAIMWLSNVYQPINLSNFTLAHNTSGNYALGVRGDVKIRNSIFYNHNNPREITLGRHPEAGPTILDIDYSLIQGGIEGIGNATTGDNSLIYGDNNLNTDPLFRGDLDASLDLEDYRRVQLTENSPCIDSGTTQDLETNITDYDIAGNPRIWGDGIDMGAYEYNPSVGNNNDDASETASDIIVNQYPNPVDLTQTNCAYLDFFIPVTRKGKVKIAIYNLKGQKVRDLDVSRSIFEITGSGKESNAGHRYSKVWNLRNNDNQKVVSGLYLYKIRIDDDDLYVGKMILLK
ncbi:DUF1565 domain-containing protein [bacterium]|nr:DUF1565 domain-containing protein [bacterium]